MEESVFITHDPRPDPSEIRRIEENVQKLAAIIQNDRCVSAKLIEGLT